MPVNPHHTLKCGKQNIRERVKSEYIMPIANRSSHGRHHSATGVTLRQESANENDKNDLHHSLRHSGSPHLTQNVNGVTHSVSSQHRPIRKRPHSSRSGVIGQNSQNTNSQIVTGQGANASDPGLDLVDLAVWAADVAPQISIPGDSSSALLAAAAAVTSSHGNLGNRYSPVRGLKDNKICF